MRLPTPFIVWNRKGRSSMLLFFKKRDEWAAPISEGQRSTHAALGSYVEGDRRIQRRNGVR
jgi:hypothetical protein